MDTSTKYPGIARAAVEMAYDNGAINRSRSEEQLVSDLEFRLSLSTVSTSQLQEIDQWLGNLDDVQLQTAVAGEELEAQALLASAPDGTNDLLEAIFNDVL